MDFGKPLESLQGLYKTLGLVDAEEVERLRAGAEQSIEKEIKMLFRDDPAATNDVDEYGWTDLDWLKYLRNEKAAETSVREGAEGTMADDVIDRGHNGMTLDAFVQHPAAVAAGLKRVHVLAA